MTSLMSQTEASGLLPVVVEASKASMAAIKPDSQGVLRKRHPNKGDSEGVGVRTGGADKRLLDPLSAAAKRPGEEPEAEVSDGPEILRGGPTLVPRWNSPRRACGFKPSPSATPVKTKPGAAVLGVKFSRSLDALAADPTEVQECLAERRALSVLGSGVGGNGHAVTNVLAGAKKELGGAAA